MRVHHIYDTVTATLTYIVWDEQSKATAIIDPVLDYDAKAVRTSTASADKVVAFVKDNDLDVRYLLETHAHADHLSSADVLKRQLGGQTGIGDAITAVQELFSGLLNQDIATDGSQFDLLLADGQTLPLGDLTITALSTPGHTPACTSFYVGDAVFTGDALLHPSLGTGRCDFPKGSAANLYSSVHNVLYTLPDATRVFVGHDYPPEGQPAKYQTSIAASKEGNRMVSAATSKDEFVTAREARDSTLQVPKLIFPAVQVNMNAGVLPAPEANGQRYLKLPLNVL